MKLDNASIDHHPDGEYSDRGLEWFYSIGSQLQGWSRSEEEADKQITEFVKRNAEANKKMKVGKRQKQIPDNL
jgi:hypothetical protein